VPLYTTLLTVLLNIAPYCKTLTATSSERIVRLLEIFTGAGTFFPYCMTLTKAGG
jgi:hypothetical protein